MRVLKCAGCGAELPPTSEREPGVLVCPACDHIHRSVLVPGSPPNPTATFDVGDTVLVTWGGRWWPAEVRRVVAEDIWEVHYDGWSDEWDEIVDVGRVRALRAPDKPLPRAVFAGLVVTATCVGVAMAGWGVGVAPAAPLPSEELSESETEPRGPITPTGVPLPAGLRVQPGTELEVMWNQSFYRAVSKVHYGDGSLSVHYVGWSDALDGEVDEAHVRISPEAILAARGPVEPTGPVVGPDAPIYEGDVLEVAWRDGVYRAVVLATYPDGRLRVHYAGWEDELDEDVPRERARRVLAADD